VTAGITLAAGQLPAAAAIAPVTVVSGLNVPEGLAVDSAGDIFADGTGDGTIEVLAKASGSVFGVPVTAGTLTTVVASGLDEPAGLALDTAGDLFIADPGAGTISVLPKATGRILGVPVTADNLTTLASGLDGPLSVAVDGAGDVYIANFYGGTVSVLPNISGSILGVPVTAGVMTTLASGLNGPSGVAVDGAGDLYFADYYSGTVSVLAKASGTIFGVTATAGSPATVASGLSFPFGLATDKAGDLFVANEDVVSADGGTVSVLAKASGTLFGVTATAGSPATVASGLDSPAALGFDAHGDLFIADAGDGTVDELTAPSSGTIAGEVTDETSAKGIAGACVEVVTSGAGLEVALLHANSAGLYSGSVAPGSYKLIASDCVGGTHATTYYGGADNYDFSGPLAKVVTVGAGSALTGLDVALPLAGTISGKVTDSSTGSGLSGICAYAIDTTAGKLRGYSRASTATGSYTITGLPPGTDKIAFEECTTGPYPLTYSQPVTVISGGTVTLNKALTKA
jgi:glucose/arabinose dehydrogenase